MSDRVREMMAAAAWERAKGALREMVVLQGFREPIPWPVSKEEHDRHHARWVVTREHVEAFIKGVEDRALQE